MTLKSLPPCLPIYQLPCHNQLKAVMDHLSVGSTLGRAAFTGSDAAQTIGVDIPLPV